MKAVSLDIFFDPDRVKRAGGAQGTLAKSSDGSFCFDTRDGILRFYNRRRRRLLVRAAARRLPLRPKI